MSYTIIHTSPQSLSTSRNLLSIDHHVNLTRLLLKTTRTIPSYYQQLYCLMTPKFSLRKVEPCEPTHTTDHYFNSVDLSNALFFIQFTPEGTMRMRWFLIQVDMSSTKVINSQYATNGKYWYIFLTHHLDDTNKSNELCIWWPDWYKCSCYATTNGIVYGERILIRPSSIPSSLGYIQWSTLLPLASKQ